MDLLAYAAKTINTFLNSFKALRARYPTARSRGKSLVLNDNSTYSLRSSAVLTVFYSLAVSEAQLKYLISVEDLHY